MFVPAFESEPVFCEEHSSWDSWTEGLGAAKASNIASDWMKGRAPSRLQIGVAMMAFVGDPRTLLMLGDSGKVTLDARIAS